MSGPKVKTPTCGALDSLHTEEEGLDRHDPSPVGPRGLRSPWGVGVGRVEPDGPTVAPSVDRRYDVARSIPGSRIFAEGLSFLRDFVLTGGSQLLTHSVYWSLSPYFCFSLRLEGGASRGRSRTKGRFILNPR